MDVRRAEAGTVRELLRVAVPLALSTGTLSVMHVTDRVFLTWHDQNALAASLPAGMLSWTLLSLFFGTVNYINTFVAQYYGSAQHHRIGTSVGQGVYLSILGGILFIPFLVWAPWLFETLGYSGQILKLEVDYFRLLGIGAMPALINSTLGCVYSGRGKTWAVFWVNAVAMLANFVLDWTLIFGHFGAPAMGIRGAAIATVAGSVISVFCWIVLLSIDPAVRPFGLWQGLRPDLELAGRIIRFGFPNGLMMLLEACLLNIFLALIGQMGNAELAATNLAFTLNTLAFIPTFGLQIAVMTLVGQRIGEGLPDIAERTTRGAILVCNTYMTIWAILYVVFPDVVLQIFGAHSQPGEFEEIRAMAIMLLRFVAAYTIFDGIQLIYSGAVRGAGDVRFSLIFFIGTEILVMVLPTWIGVQFFNMQLAWAWSWMTAWVVILAFGFWLRFRGGRWKSMSVIEENPIACELPPAPSEELVPSGTY